MDVETETNGDNKRLNGFVAVTVVVFSVFMAVCGIKSGNIGQNLQHMKTEQNDAWAEYQGTRLKLNLAEVNMSQLRVQLAGAGSEAHRAAIEKEIAATQSFIDKQNPKAEDQIKKAKSYAERLEALNFVDDQFDLEEALVAIAIAIAAVSALVASWWLLAGAWVIGGFGVAMGLAGFLGWSLHPGWLIGLLT